GAVARLAEDAFAELDGEQRVVARSVLMRLVGEGAAGGVERRRVALAELETVDGDEVDSVVALLTDRRLLTASTGTIELAHEALLREWPRLRDWIEADRDGLRIHRNVSAAALEWEQLGRDGSALYRGTRLAEALEWNQARQPRLNESERAFLASAEAARQRERVTRRRRIALAFGSLTVALLAISIVAVVAVVQGRKTASRELANRSQAVLGGDPALALAIALDALQRRDTAEARTAVRQATLADRETAVIHASPAPIYRAALSPDGSRVATAGDDGLVRISSVEEGRVVSTIKGHAGPALDVSFSPSGTRVASVGLDGTVAVADLDGGRRRVVARLGGNPGPYPRSVEYSPDGRELLVAVTDGTIRLISLADSRSSIVARHSGVRVARFDRSGRRILSAGQDGYARLWTIAGGATASMPHGKGVDLFDAAISPDGSRVATAGDDGAIRIWDAGSGQLLHKLALDLQPLYSLQFSADGERIVTGGADGVVRVSDVRGGPVLAELKGHRDRAYDAGFTGEDGVYSAGTDGTVRLWAPPQTATLPVDDAGVPYAPTFSPKSNEVLSGYDDGEVRLWNPATGRPRALARYEEGSSGAYSPDGAYILSWTSAYTKGSMRVYDVRRRTSSFARVPSARGVYAAAIAPGGRRIARVGLGTRAVLQAPDGTHRRTLPAHGQVNWLAFSPDAEHLVTASDDGTARTWNASSAAAERVLKGIEGAALWVAYSPDGKRVAVAGADGTIRVWTLAGGDPLVLYGHEGPVNTVAFNPRGDRLVSGGKDGTVRVWDADDGEPIVLLHTHEGEVTGVAFSPDGQDVVSGADDGLRVSACDVCGAFGPVLALARTRPGAKLTAAQRARLTAGGG
ncbi:MAG: hypothetical protein QOG42_55, partial [Solirubrobacteraceae bacterium]|nr:hypothetical protein [Solirubrobacteraceae bacterium]